MKINNNNYRTLVESFFKYRHSSGINNPYEENRLRLFVHYCETIKPDSCEITQEMIDRWSMKRDSETAVSRNARICILVAFLRYLNKHLSYNYIIPERIKNSKSNYIPHSFTEEELAQFFEQCDNLPKIKGIQMSIKRLVVPTFFRLLYSTGMRPIEARLLLRKDVNIEEGFIRINESKGGNQHYVALHHSMISILKKYDISINKIQPDRKFFFESSSGNPFNTRWVIRTFHQVWNKANGNKEYVIPYDLRHHYAITNINRWQNDGFDFNEKMLFLSKSMGHSSIEATLYYYSLVPRLASTIRKNTEKEFNNIVPEIDYENK